jgi:hypothetical protein
MEGTLYDQHLQTKKIPPPAFPGQAEVNSHPDPLLTDEGREEFEVEEILDQKQNHGQTEYHV